ncbi:hypothetical protein M422DRAFT_48088 [Sphaerobolus stellatus SS14]|uniref:Uncharacterized protein n=1 Tax=Sphaerobolus stellatus (strain SS14) TaxID=990650 RepID=A0A0C9VLH8_SPHS4|nr:hypothetical protein M422DRAFT_48088 [Sphaerobolus stellatus SS14]
MTSLPAERQELVKKVVKNAFNVTSGQYAPDVLDIAVRVVRTYGKALLIEIEDTIWLRILRTLMPSYVVWHAQSVTNAHMLSKLSLAPDHRTITVTQRTPPGAFKAFRSRVFAPIKGVGEDPVTGSFQCPLDPY